MPSIDELAGMDPVVRTEQAPPQWAPGHTIQSVEDKKNQQAEDMKDTQVVSDSFMHGGNWGVSIAKDIMRKGENGGVDPTWTEASRAEFIEANKSDVQGPGAWRYNLTGNAQEAQALMAEEKVQKSLADMWERRGGISTTVAQMIPGLLDIDAPISLATGGISKLARAGLSRTAIGRMAGMGIEGGLGMTLASAGAYYSQPSSDDWTVIPVAGLMGASMGVGRGLFTNARKAVEGAVPEVAPDIRTDIGHGEVSAPANLQREKVLEEFGTSVAEGNVLAKQDIRSEKFDAVDSWGGDARRAEALAAQEEADLAAKESAPAGGASPPKPKAFRIEEVKSQGEHPEGWVIADGSVGAAQRPSTGPGINSIASNAVKDIIRRSEKFVNDTGIADDWYNNESRFDAAVENSPLPDAAKDAIRNSARRFHDIVTASPVVSDFGRLMRTGSPVAQKFAYDTMESASGIIRNNRSAAMIMDHYEKQLRSTLIPLSDAFTEWAVKDKKASRWERGVDGKIRAEFNQLVTSELQGRAYDGASHQRSKLASVTRAADAIDEWSARDVEISQGRPGEGAIHGSENLVPASGYMPQRWDGRKIQKIISDGGATGRKRVIDAVTNAYKSMHPAVKPADLKIWATATVDRAVRSNEGVSSNIMGILQADGRTAVEDALRRQGLSESDITNTIDKLTDSMQDRQKQAHLKSRIDVDMRFKDSNGITIMDLMDTDLDRIVSKRSRQTAGAAALARKGIRSKADFNEIKHAILEDQLARGQSQNTPNAGTKDKIGDFIDSDKHIDGETLDHMYSYFGSGPIAGGVSPTVARMKKTTNLSLLNQLGLAQMAEFGSTIATVGVKRFFEIMPDAMRAEFKNVESPIMKELRHMNVFVPEERLFRDDLTFEAEKHNGSAGELAQKFDNMLNKAQRLQGYTSGFYKMRNIQQRIATTAAADKIMRDLKYGGANGTITWERLKDAGFDGDLLTRVHQYVNDDTVKFKRRNLEKLNLDKWEPRDAEDFILTINRQTNQLVQKAMSGESSVLFHKDGVASLFLHLKAFPMLAMEKQAYRSLRLFDEEAGMTALYGLGTAAVAYTIKQAINGRDDNLNAKAIASGAFNMSNLTGWIPMWTDPVAAMLGMDSLRFNHYANARGQAPVFSAPAAYETLNRMITIPGAVGHIIQGDMSTSDVRALQTIPLFGNAAGFTAMFNNMKDYAKENQKQIRSNANKDRKAVESGGVPEDRGNAMGRAVSSMFGINTPIE